MYAGRAEGARIRSVRDETEGCHELANLSTKKESGSPNTKMKCNNNLRSVMANELNFIVNEQVA